MRSKVLAAEVAAAAGIPTVIAAGAGTRRPRRPSSPASRAARASRPASAPRRRSSSGFASASPCPGRLRVDDGARRRAQRATARACSRSGSLAAKAASQPVTASRSSDRTVRPSRRASRAPARTSYARSRGGSRPSTATASSCTSKRSVQERAQPTRPQAARPRSPAGKPAYPAPEQGGARSADVSSAAADDERFAAGLQPSAAQRSYGAPCDVPPAPPA